mmetsp:Transcript_26806/g.50436  ORF Transcript_26806/g.50436 Transcript_26806/m.50436 type:complete len:84 (+) Transcript_26806:69-320(+)
MRNFLRLALAAVGILTSSMALSLEAGDEPSKAASEGNEAAVKMTLQQCKVSCQRFGMKRMGEAFKDITRPQDCVAKCEEVYKA